MKIMHFWAIGGPGSNDGDGRVCPVSGSTHTISCESYVIYSDRLDSYRDSGRERSIANECAELQRE